jgi:hypothetical protein
MTARTSDIRTLRTLRVYDGFYHQRFNEPAEDRAQVLADLHCRLLDLAAAPVKAAR